MLISMQKRKRIAAGSGEKMRKKGAPGAPAKNAFAKIRQSENRKKKESIMAPQNQSLLKKLV